MKNLTDYLYDKFKTYQFIIKIADGINDEQISKLKASLEKFEVIKLSEGRSTPIQQKPMGFDSLNNMAITSFDLEIKYPTIPPVLREYIAQILDKPLDYVIVHYENDPVHEPTPEAGELLNTHEMEQADPNAQDLVGQSRVNGLLKELNKTKHQGEQYKGVNEQVLASNLPEDTKAVIMQLIDTASKSTIGSSPIKFINPGD